VTPLFSIKLSYLTPSMCFAWIFPFGAQSRIFWSQTAPVLLTLAQNRGSSNVATLVYQVQEAAKWIVLPLMHGLL
jgi:hypothetical protein